MKKVSKIILFFAVVMALPFFIGCSNGIIVRNNTNKYFVNSINHRGWHEAPENTLAAYRASAEKGFNMVECDVNFTKDDIPVLIHDGDIKRTSNGNGKVRDMLWSEISTYDFGSWKSKKYAGERIPKFEEFINLCRNLSLHPYIDMKKNTNAEQIKGLVDIVIRYGLKDNVTWISRNKDVLNEVCNVYSKSRIGYVVSKLSDDAINVACELRTDNNDVFIDCEYRDMNIEYIPKCIENSIPLEVWAVDDIQTIVELDPYISGVTSNLYIAGEVLKIYGDGSK